jgi:hypothetical protein
MDRIPHWIAVAFCAALLGTTSTAFADGPPEVAAPACCSDQPSYGKTHCPPPAYYSPFRYWAPTLARIYDCCCGPKISVYAPDRHPEVPPTFKVLTYACPPVDPEATVIRMPQPPSASVQR